jgi:hypothetical protein
MISTKFARKAARGSVGALVAAGLLFGPTITSAAAATAQPAQAVSKGGPTDEHSRTPSKRFLALINDARQHPEKYPPHGNTAGATMTACPSPLKHSIALQNTSAAHNGYLASQPLSWVNTDSNVHKDPNGMWVWDSGEPMEKAGYHSWRAEIVAYGFPTTADALRFWMQDDAPSNWGHRNYILNCTIQEAGPAIHNGGPGSHYYTVDMGTK